MALDSSTLKNAKKKNLDQRLNKDLLVDLVVEKVEKM